MGLRPCCNRRNSPERISTAIRFLRDTQALLVARYHCSHCDSLQDATRYTKLRGLPPVLHFSLMRFVYDLSTMERKKSKHIVSFPTIIDMGNYVDKGEESPSHGSTNIYNLRGVLLHKGPSAYHGHYEAQVFDETYVLCRIFTSCHSNICNSSQCWFQFNDESVTKINTLGDRIVSKKKKDEGDAEQGWALSASSGMA